MKAFFYLLLGTFLAAPAIAETSPITVSADEHFEIVIDDRIQPEDRDYYFNFGRVRVNRSASAIFTLRNNGRIPLYIQDIDIDGTGFRRNDNCPQFLFSGDRCRIRVIFRPPYVGRFRGELEVELTGAEDIKVHLFGRGVRRR